MKPLLSVLVTAVCFLAFLKIYWMCTAGREPHQKKEPTPKSVPTMFDVRRLLQEGKKDAAVRVYSRIFKVSAQKARKDVEDLDRSLEV